jgi:ubiquinol-cytochrome c reductase subunit 7
MCLRNNRADDLIPEENPQTLAALKRLSPKESYDRSFRIRRAIQCSIQHKLLPKNEWTKPEDDVPYLMPLVEQIAAEAKEKRELDTINPDRSH